MAKQAIAEQALGRWDKTGDIVTTIQQMRDLKAELGSLPKVKVLPTPPRHDSGSNASDTAGT